VNKGTHLALKRFKTFAHKESKNNTETLWILKCDIRKFFASTDHSILLSMLSKHIQDREVLNLLELIIQSFQSMEVGKGLPLGNLTSQLLVNVYMNEFDQYMKHTIKATYYIRYADDFLIMSRDREWLEQVREQ
jgi:retron-type reverse transcriptase